MQGDGTRGASSLDSAATELLHASVFPVFVTSICCFHCCGRDAIFRTTETNSQRWRTCAMQFSRAHRSSSRAGVLVMFFFLATPYF